MSQDIGKINSNLLAQLNARQQPTTVAPPIQIASGSHFSMDEASQLQTHSLAYQKMAAEQRAGNATVTVAEFNKFYVLSAFTNIHQRVSEKLQKIINSVDGIRDFYLVEVILSQLTEDALAPKIGSDEIVRFSHKNPEVQDSINDMKERIGLDQIIENIIPDLCAYGDYIMETDIDVGVGLAGLYDNVDQGKTIPLVQDGRTDGYLHVDDMTNEITKRELCDFIHFTLTGQRIKVRFDQSLPFIVKNNVKLRSFFKKTPKYLRVGRSMLYPVLGKLRELELLEKLVPATKINKLSQGNTVGVPVPEGYDLERGFNAAKQIENNINRKVMVDNTMQEITVEAILSTAGRTRVIPVFGDKGRLEKLDYKGDEADDLFSNTKELRDIICDSIGVPSELVFKSDGASKNDILKRYAKYLRKLKKIQKAVINGCQQIIAIHLANSEKFKNVDPKSVEIILNNHLVEIDNLDRLEHADITVGFTKNVTEYFAELMAADSPYRSHIQFPKVVEFLAEQLKTIGLTDAVQTSQDLVQAGQVTQGQANAIDTIDNKTENPDFKPELPPPGASPSQYASLPFDPTQAPNESRQRVNERRQPQNFTKVVKK